jgi:transposase
MGKGRKSKVSAPAKATIQGADREAARAEAARLRAEGLSLRAIGKKLGVDQKQVQRWLKAARLRWTPLSRPKKCLP